MNTDRPVRSLVSVPTELYMINFSASALFTSEEEQD
jgi:hypothetical protein